jgi:hypothetical protein
MAFVKLSKTYFLGNNEIQKQTKIATRMELWKYGQILAVKWLNFSKKKSSYEFIILYYIIYWIPITSLDCESI